MRESPMYLASMVLIFDRATVCLDHKFTPLLHTPNTPLPIFRGKFFPFFADNSFHFLDIMNLMPSFRNPELYDHP